MRRGADFACVFGHTDHGTRTVNVRLDGPFPELPDAPPVPPHLTVSFPMVVFNAPHYRKLTDPGYCQGRDEVSYSILLQGVWEAFETVLVLEILNSSPGLVFDLGAHIGWYTLLAGLSGHTVVAVEADHRIVPLLKTNLNLNELVDRVEIVEEWIGPDMKPGFGVGGLTRLIKMDLEGLEDEAIRVCHPLLAYNNVDYLLVEVSPVLAGHYPQTIQTLEGYGYRGFVVPVIDPHQFGADPLGQVQQYPLGALDFDQRNVLFIREDLCN